ncbi:hypothetical protein F4813DRAFT_392172 [Daldinia decipiens]|uniref:uncharacterized protein n=1 Tax=Daldinia decipiens TaxID=326647 RepID=UPI0020C43C47|nr:uncharacterized protein F4813DRAFT_392172 [Daldinia decipiens]KAI1654922.1 hypothetical protein F4813DRAFT_392172 [Daldinia decipiens]
MSFVPVEKVVIAQYGEQRVAQETMPDVEAWVVDSKVEKGIPFKLWMRPELHENLKALYPSLPNAEEITRGGGFLQGRPMLKPAITIETCDGDTRPKRLYRVVHARNPFGGIKARGYGTVDINPLHFQVLVQKHLNWNCSSPSPFLSVTDNLNKVTVIAAVCEARGFAGIEVLEFDPAHPSWDHRHQRLWNARHLVDQFGTKILQRREFLHQEFLVENMIPPESILRRRPWKSLRGILDPGEFWLNMMRKKVKHISRLKRRRGGGSDGEGEVTNDKIIHKKDKKKTVSDGPGTEGSGEETAVVMKKRRVIDFKLRL